MPKVLIAIPAWHTYEYGNQASYLKVRVTKERIQAQRKTWVKDVAPFASYVDVRFFFENSTRYKNAWQSLQYAKPIAQDDEVLLDVAADFENLAKKMQAIYRWALAKGYDYVFEADHNTWIYVDRLLRSCYEHADYLRFAQCRCPNKQQCKCCISGGPGYWLSKRAVQCLVNAPNTSWTEGLWTDNVLRKNGIRPTYNESFVSGFDKHWASLPHNYGTCG